MSYSLMIAPFEELALDDNWFQRSLNMDYEQFITEIQKYWDLRKKGLKKIVQERRTGV